MFRALICPSSGAWDYVVDYHIGRVVLGLLYVGGTVQLDCSSVQVAGYNLQPGYYYNMKWHLVRFLFFGYHNDARSDTHKVYISNISVNVHCLEIQMQFHCTALCLA